MYYKSDIPVNNDQEFLASEKNIVAFTQTVVATGVTADDYGQKRVFKGTLMGASGKAVAVTGGGTVSFSENPIGILMDTVNVTYGDQPGAFLVEGYVIGERLTLGAVYTAAIGAAITAKLPGIKFV